MRVLVTGAGGFIGRHLCLALRAQGFETIAIGRRNSAAHRYVDSFIAIEGKPQSADLEGMLVHVQPDAVYHLAGSSTAPTLHELYDTNVFYAARLLQACRSLKKTPKIIMAGSAAEYGKPQRIGRPIKEADPALPLGAYGETKLAQTVHALRQTDLPVIAARIFNPIGEGLPISRAAGRFVERAKALKSLGGGIIETGPLDAVRDVVDVAQLCDAMIDLTVKNVPTGQIYNLCSGHGTTMRNITDTLQAMLPYRVNFQSRGGAGGVDWAVGDAGKLSAHDIKINAPVLSAILERMLAEPGDPRRETRPDE